MDALWLDGWMVSLWLDGWMVGWMVGWLKVETWKLEV